MQEIVVNWKPILFKNSLNKFCFLRHYDYSKIKNFNINLAILDYDSKDYKRMLENNLIKNLKRYKGSFMVISNLQFAYVARELQKHNFYVDHVEYLDEFITVNKEDLLKKTNVFNSFFYCKHVISKVLFKNGSEYIVFSKSGVIKIKTQNSNNACVYLNWLIAAYYQSQG